MVTKKKPTTRSKIAAKKTATPKSTPAGRPAAAKVTAKPTSSRPILSAKPDATVAATAPSATAPTTAALAAKPTSAPAMVEKPTVSGVTLPDVAMTKKLLLEQVSAKAGVRKAQARPIVEAMLDVLGAALVRGETLKLQPMGVMKVTRQKEIEQADIVVCKLRRKKSQEGDNDPLAEAAE